MIQIAGYQILEELGRGGMAVVYRALDLNLRREVAIKVLRPELSEDPEATARLEREARVVARLEHPHIVPLYGAQRVEAHGLALIMPLVEGITLKSELRSRGPLPFAVTRKVLGELADALEYAHGKGVIHRDIKPDNVFIQTATQRALLADFGIARALDSMTHLTQTGTAIGSPHYMSPEQIVGEEVDRRSDIYSLGLIGWEMLAGVQPWEGESLYTVIWKQKNDVLPPIDQFRPDLPEDLGEVLARALCKDPKDRWKNAGSLHQALSLRDAPSASGPSFEFGSPETPTSGPNVTAPTRPLVETVHSDSSATEGKMTARSNTVSGSSSSRSPSESEVTSLPEVNADAKPPGYAAILLTIVVLAIAISISVYNVSKPPPMREQLAALPGCAGDLCLAACAAGDQEACESMCRNGDDRACDAPPQTTSNADVNRMKFWCKVARAREGHAECAHYLGVYFIDRIFAEKDTSELRARLVPGESSLMFTRSASADASDTLWEDLVDEASVTGGYREFGEARIHGWIPWSGDDEAVWRVASQWLGESQALQEYEIYYMATREGPAGRGKRTHMELWFIGKGHLYAAKMGADEKIMLDYLSRETFDVSRSVAAAEVAKRRSANGRIERWETFYGSPGT